MSKVKLPFSEIHYNPSLICWGRGNDVVSLQCLATIKIQESTNCGDEREKADYEKALSVYAKIEKGAMLEINNHSCKVTNINYETQIINIIGLMSEEQKALGYKPAKLRTTINAFISMVKTDQIKFI